MATPEIESKFRELRSLRRQACLWGVCAFSVIVGSVVVAGWRMKRAADGLLQPGPTQERMVSQIQHRVGGKILSTIRSDARMQLGEIQPILLKNLQQVDAFAPRVASQAVRSLQRLSDDLPNLGPKTLGTANALSDYPRIVAPYQGQITDILASLKSICAQEAPNVKGVKPTWNMDLMVLEEMHGEKAVLQGGSK